MPDPGSAVAPQVGHWSSFCFCFGCGLADFSTEGGLSGVDSGVAVEDGSDCGPVSASGGASVREDGSGAASAATDSPSPESPGRSGIWTGAQQAGHLPDFPARRAGTRSTLPHAQLTVSVACSAGAALGMATIFPQAGHFPFLPRALSGTDSCLPQEHFTFSGMLDSRRVASGRSQDRGDRGLPAGN